MIIFGKVKPDDQGRIRLYPEFIPKNAKEVSFVVEDANEMISVCDSRELGFGLKSKIDNEKRAVIPKWLMEEIGDAELLCVEMEGKFFLSKKTGDII